jgi:hypothetical protein
VELVLGFLRHDDISMRLAGADALLVFLAAIHDDLAFVGDDAGGDNDEAGVEAELLSAVPGQHELFQLRSRLDEMGKARDRRASKADNKALRSLVERLLKLSHALARRTDQLVLFFFVRLSIQPVAAPLAVRADPWATTEGAQRRQRRR